MTSMLNLIFDVDGTIAETEEVHRRAFNETFAAAGLPWRWDRVFYKGLLDITGGKERLRHFIDTHAPPQGDVWRDRVADLHARKTERYCALIDAGEAAIRPGVRRLIAEAQQSGARLALATTTSLPNVEALFRAAFGVRLDELFAVIGAGDMVAAKKPAPDIYRFVVERLGVHPSEAIALEDSYNGLKAAMGAGLATVITSSTYTMDDDFSGALAVVSDFGEPDAPYRHLAGAGAGDRMVSLDTLQTWINRSAR
jgi:HAD superfamily hydrolase (TIGR01509 family)